MIPASGEAEGRIALPLGDLLRELRPEGCVGECGDALRVGAVHDAFPGGHEVEELRAVHLEESQPGARVDLRVYLSDAARCDVGEVGQVLAPLLRAQGALDDGEVRYRTPARLRHPGADPVAQLLVHGVADLDDASVEALERAGDGVQFVEAGDVRGQQFAVHADVPRIAVERYAERAGLHALSHGGLNRLDLVAGGLAILRLVAHDPSADGGVSDQRAVVDAKAVIERTEVLAERAPAPRYAVHQYVVGDGLDLGEHPGERGFVARPHRRKRERAVAADDGGDAVVGGEAAERVERYLPVVVGVVVDESGGYDMPASVDGARGGVAQTSDRGDAPVRDADIGLTRGRAGAVNDEATRDQQVECHSAPPPDVGSMLALAGLWCMVGWYWG